MVFLRKIFEVFEKYKTPIDMVTTSEVSRIRYDRYRRAIVKHFKGAGTIWYSGGR